MTRSVLASELYALRYWDWCTEEKNGFLKNEDLYDPETIEISPRSEELQSTILYIAISSIVDVPNQVTVNGGLR